MGRPPKEKKKISSGEQAKRRPGRPKKSESKPKPFEPSVPDPPKGVRYGRKLASLDDLSYSLKCARAAKQLKREQKQRRVEILREGLAKYRQKLEVENAKLRAQLAETEERLLNARQRRDGVVGNAGLSSTTTGSASSPF